MNTIEQQNRHLAYAKGPFFAAVQAEMDERQLPDQARPDDEFLYKYMQGALADDFAEINIEAAAAMAVDLWTFDLDAEHQRQARVRPVQISNLHSVDIIETVGGDISFLVDSTIAACIAGGRELRAVVHVIVDKDGHKRSLIQIHLAQMDNSDLEPMLDAVRETLSDVALANADYLTMRKKMLTTNAQVRMCVTPEGKDPSDISEAAEFLEWLGAGNFIFLGARDYDLPTSDHGEPIPAPVEDSGLGILRDPERRVLNKGPGQSGVAPGIASFLEDHTPVIVAKSNTLSLVHRRVYADYVGVKRHNHDGQVIGETRFIGLFTSEVYTCSVRDIPMIRRKVGRIRDIHNTGGSKHSTQALDNVLETFPRDELFQIDENDLLAIARGILALRLRPRTRLFIRRDCFDRFVSALMYTPRENFSGTLQRRVHKTLADAYAGRMSASYANSSDGPLARVHFIVGLNPGHPEPNENDLGSAVAALAQNWEDALARRARAEGKTFSTDFTGVFSAAYTERFDTDEALDDLDQIEHMQADERLSTRICTTLNHTQVRCKLYHRDTQMELSDIVPILENMGLRVHAETGYCLALADPDGTSRPVWIHDITMTNAAGKTLPETFPDAFSAIWEKRTENDGFNQVVILLGVHWRQAALLRALCRYRKQSGLDPSETVQIGALAGNGRITQLLLDLFALRFDPTRAASLDERKTYIAECLAAIDEALDAVSSRDDDRVLRRLTDVISATRRTSFYRSHPGGEGHISLKIASSEIPDLPDPKPYREIFVWSPEVEGVHLRFGSVARGGLRWSDRRDDFRTEVLGLVKAQQIKNAVIVPVGSKGCFYPKALPRNGSREEINAAGTLAYTTFVGAMIDLTDNLIDGDIVHPDQCVIWDRDDPYLVVAADKGTAAFSDTANAMSAQRGFWLGDAFASGGSVGYDHKKMGITARGAWEAVKRHFREIGKDIQSQDFSVVGVGDMSGDVFGNGMLLSRRTKLLAAFNHRHIFVDPDPDPASSWEERKRLFDMGRSSWSDYDAELISAGGGVFSREAKSIELSDQIRTLTGLAETAVAPETLIAALLRAEVELLWFGGVGTYVKASDEQHMAVGDKANDAVRADACHLRAKVIGEGANLAITQAGRVEFARNGGRINTDALDNSAGVDSSDHEVNIKILLSEAIAAGDVAHADRASLLASMTDDVARSVLANNYRQSGLLTLMEASAGADVGQHEHLIETLSRAGVLDPVVEGLPDSEGFRALADQGQGLTRPEMSVLAACAKIDLFNRILASEAPDDPEFEKLLEQYFPSALSGYGDARARHRLRREIISTILANRLVNAVGPTAPYTICDSLGVDIGDLVLASEAARAIFALDALTAQTDALDNQIRGTAQTVLYREIANCLIKAGVILCLRSKALQSGGVTELIARYRPGVEAVSSQFDDMASDFQNNRSAARSDRFVAAGVPVDIAARFAGIDALLWSIEAIDIASASGWPVHTAFLLHSMLAEALGLDRMRAYAEEAMPAGNIERMAISRIAADLPGYHVRLTGAVIAHLCSLGHDPEKIERSDAMVAVDSWLNPHEATIKRLFGPMRGSGSDHYRSLASLVLARDSIAAIVAQIATDKKIQQSPASKRDGTELSVLC